MKIRFFNVKTTLGLALAVFASTTLVAADPGGSTNRIALKAGHLLDVAHGQVLERQIILIENGLIKAVGPEGSVAIPEGTKTLDLGKSWVLPGLIDCHTHLTLDVEPGWENLPVKETVPESALRSARNALLTLHAGFTTVRDVGA